MPIKQHNATLPESEWFVPFRADSVSSRGRSLTIKAETSHLKAIAKRIGVKELKALQAEINFDLQNGGHILHMAGRFKADVIQECVTTMEPLESIIEDDFEAWYADHEKAVSFNRAKQQIKAIEEGDEVQMLEEKDDPEALIDGQVDLGEVVIQFLSLAINPYPRKEGVTEVGEIEISAAGTNKVAGTLRPNPFAALKNWRPKD